MQKSEAKYSRGSEVSNPYLRYFNISNNDRFLFFLSFFKNNSKGTSLIYILIYRREIDERDVSASVKRFMMLLFFLHTS